MLVDLPNLPGLFQVVNWTLVIPQQVTRSAWTGAAKVVGLPGAEAWTATAGVLPMASEAEARLWRAFIVSCRGGENSFHMPAPQPWPTPVGNPQVTAAVAGNRAVIVDDSSAVEIGMYATVLQADGRYRMVLIVGINGQSIHFEPYLRAEPTIGVELDIVTPFCPMRLSSNAQAIPHRSIPSGFELKMEEAL